MTNRISNILITLIVFAPLALGVWLYVRAADPGEIKNRLERVESIRKVFGEHVKRAVFWRSDDETAHVWTSTEREDRGFYYTGTGVVATFTPDDTCDSQQECEDALDDMCAAAGWGGVNPATVVVQTHMDNSKTCSGDCINGCNAAGQCPIAFVICDAPVS